jgi:transcriptional regulator with XRE-family HTH domain
MNIGSNIQKFRLEKGFTQSDLANHFGKSKATVARWESGENRPDADIIREICNFLGVPPNTLFNWTDDTSNTYFLTKAEQNLIEIFRGFNKDGQEKLLDTADDMLSSKKYKKCNTISSLGDVE